MEKWHSDQPSRKGMTQMETEDHGELDRLIVILAMMMMIVFVIILAMFFSYVSWKSMGLQEVLETIKTESKNIWFKGQASYWHFL